MIQHCTVERIPNPNPEGPHPWQVHYTVWNAVVRVCRRHGRVGPFHERPITDNPDGLDDDDWPLGDDPCDFWMNPDWLNDERYFYVEIPNAAVFTETWLRDLMMAMREFPGWGVGINAFPTAYILAFGEKLMVTGRIFENCNDIGSVVRQGHAELAPLRRT